MEIEKCEVTVIHEEVVNRVKKQMPSEDKLIQTAELLKVFGDPTRIQILHALEQHEMCVCDIAVLLNITKSSTSEKISWPINKRESYFTPNIFKSVGSKSKLEV